MGIKVKGISTVDGRTIELDLDSNVLSALYEYNYNANNTPPPASGQVRTDSDDPHDTTKVWLHRSDSSGKDLKYLLSFLARKDSRLYIQDVGNSDARAVFKLLEDPIDDGAYLTFNVEYDIASGVSLKGMSVLLGLLVSFEKKET